MITIPKDRQWIQKNSSDVFGSLESSYNVYFDEEGYLKISPKALSIYSKSEDADFDLPVSILRYGNGYFILTYEDPFQLSSNLSLARITGGPNNFGFFSDAIVWQGRVYCTTSGVPTASLVYWNGSTWTTGVKTLTTNVHHCMEVFQNQNALAIANGNQVVLLDTSHSDVGGTPLVIPSDYEITCLKYFNSNLYVGTRSTNGRSAKIFVWNGAGSTAQNAIESGSDYVMALEEYKSSIIGVTTEGQIVSFTGAGFAAIANFPVYYSPYRWSAGQNRRVHFRGLRVDGDILYINIDGAVSYGDDAFYLKNQPSGVWCYDPKVGLYCRHLSTTDPLITQSVSSMASSSLFFASNIRAQTGEPILISNVGSLTGITANETYFIIKESGGKLKLALTPADAKAGNFITLGGTSGSAAAKYAGYTQYGEKTLNAGVAGALGLTRDSFSGFFPKFIRESIIWGVQTSDTIERLNILSIASNVGGFITNKIWSDQITDFFQKVFIKYDNVELESESIVIKGRVQDLFGLPTSLVTGSFTDTETLAVTTPYLQQVEVGNNIDFLMGPAGGKTSQITEISVARDEFSIEDTLFEVSPLDPATFLVDNFKIRGNIDSTGTYKEISLAESSSWCQIMGELRGQNIRIEEIKLANATSKQTK